MGTNELDPIEALDKFLAVIRQQASDDPKFASRLLNALGSRVVFRGQAASVVDPLQVAMMGQEEFRKTFLSFAPKSLKDFVKDFNLGTAADMKGKTKAPQIVDLMWEGAQAKLRDRGLK